MAGGAAPRLLAWAGAVAVAALVWWASSQPGGDLPPTFPHADKLVHAAIYAVLAALVAAGLPGRRVARLAAAIAIAAAYGVIDELHQRHVPGRDASVADLVADLAGATLGAWAVVYRRRHGDRP